MYTIMHEMNAVNAALEGGACVCVCVCVCDVYLLLMVFDVFDSQFFIL